MIDMAIFVPILFVIIIAAFFLPILLLDKTLKTINKKNDKEYPVTKNKTPDEKKDEIKSFVFLVIFVIIMLSIMVMSELQ